MKKLLTLTVFALSISGICYAQDSSVESDKLYPAFEVDHAPEFARGQKAWEKYVKKSLKIPKEAKEKGIEGKVWVQFIVEKDGTLTSVETVKGICAECDQIAARIVKTSGRWTPGKKDGQSVRVQHAIPILFKL